jgi:5-methyltetrahydrofolate--homocysteine methyltransferase
MAIIDDIKDRTMRGKFKEIEDLVNTAINNGLNPDHIIQNGFIPAMDMVGQRFQKNEIYIPEMLVAAKTMNKGLEILKPLMINQKSKTLATVVLGTVKGDLHDIGKNLVRIMMEGVGMRVIDLGIDVAPENFIEAIKTNTPQILAMSALLTTTMPAMQTTMEAINESGLRKNLYIIVGGAPVTADFAKKIGADDYGDNAGEAVDKIKRLFQ